jgi:hypothetical protein
MQNCRLAVPDDAPLHFALDQPVVGIVLFGRQLCLSPITMAIDS